MDIGCSSLLGPRLSQMTKTQRKMLASNVLAQSAYGLGDEQSFNKQRVHRYRQ